jgi:hypothetical protein
VVPPPPPDPVPDPDPDPVPDPDPDPDPDDSPPPDGLSDFVVSAFAPSAFAPSVFAAPSAGFASLGFASLGFASLGGLLLAYRSLYQPLPLSWNAVREISRSSSPPHASHTVIGGSDMRCWYSDSFAHFVQRYSYTGMAAFL